jgi:5-methylcytosine-specific restriction protein A
MHAIAQVLNSYLTTSLLNRGVAHRNGTADEQALLETLPSFFRTVLANEGRDGDFSVVGSFGNGNMPKVPWVGVFNRAVTTSAQEGYYIVLLFSEDMQSCYLSLNQGVTELRTQYGPALAQSKMMNAAMRSLSFFKARPDALVGKIDLRASSHLGKGYEAGAIESHKYLKAELPDESFLTHDFLSLLEHYDRLVSLAGPSLQFLAPVTEDEFHQAALRKAQSTDVERGGVTGPLQIPALNTTTGKKYPRNVYYSGFALRRAGFLCEINAEHPTFIARAGNRKYVEAHHLVPMSKQSTFTVSLDHPSNIVALCTSCHKLLHHGRDADKRANLIKLLSERKGSLAVAGIKVSEVSLLSFYNGTLLEQE